MVGIFVEANLITSQMTRTGRKNQKRNYSSQEQCFPEETDNFRAYSLYPKVNDIYNETPKLYPIKTKGPYRSTEHYLDVNFKVLREDFVSSLRQGLRMYRQQLFNNKSCNTVSLQFKVKNVLSKINGIEFYKKVRFITNNKVCFDVENEIRGEDWESTKRFKTGSLLLFSSNNFESFFAAIVANTDVNELKRKYITVELAERETYEKSVIDRCFTMVESDSFFTPYYHVLKALQEFDETNLPFKKYLVDVNIKQQPPGYLNSNDMYHIKCGLKQVGFKVLNDLEWPTPSQLGLDLSQFQALKSALTNELAVIQGPPGTGKTFIGLKIVETLLANSRFWNQNKTPILVVCYTNHALDQFLEALLSFTSRLVRIGKCDGGILEKFNLREKKKQFTNGRQMNQNWITIDLQILQSALVVGTTTTLAAKHRQLLSYLAPKIVIVEEAAEVFEAHILASLTIKCQHLIMIGDHKQLRPNVNEVRLARQYKLDVSLFERLILNGMPHQMLVTQHRMRPEISKLLVRTIYPKLQNHQSVLGREDVRGMTKNIFFMTHKNQEEQAGNTSKKNDFEAMVLLKLANYLLQQGYKPEEITILATYKGQTDYMEDKSRSQSLPRGLRITTVDNYQGEENKIILLSLVRSNCLNDVGFLKIENRICVALSRAREGFFIVGDMDCLISGSLSHMDAWNVIRECLKEQYSYGTSLPLRCQVHKNQVTRITSLKDFDQVSNGGCSLPCGQRLRCGHNCKSKCHGISQQHRRCTEMCSRVLCNAGHRCNRQCSQPCEKCPCYFTPIPRQTVSYEPIFVLVRSEIEREAKEKPMPMQKSKKWWFCTIL